MPEDVFGQPGRVEYVAVFVGYSEGASLEAFVLVTGEGGVQVEGSTVEGNFVGESSNLSDVARVRLWQTIGGREGH